jgi:hypothetical protein
MLSEFFVSAIEAGLSVIKHAKVMSLCFRFHFQSPFLLLSWGASLLWLEIKHNLLPGVVSWNLEASIPEYFPYMQE